jgi:NAD(P)-dependent dehydrogenase (short-subunit alcohol dehydrogenase family)
MQEVRDTSEPVIRPAGEKLKGRVAMVTGGTRGIGAAICRSLAAQGASIAAGYSQDRERADAFQAELARQNVGASIHQGNVGSTEDCARTVQEVIKHHGRLDILVNNAGITSDRTVAKMTPEDWYRVIAVNLSGAFFMSKEALEHMVERGSGRIINVSSLAGQTGNIGQTNYAASKSGMFGLTMSMAREAAFTLRKAGRDPNGIGVTVNAVAPGYTETEMLGTVPEKVIERIVESVPVGRLARPEEIGRVVHFLAADASSYITGQVWSVNGGINM